jgi:hypothetical protein
LRQATFISFPTLLLFFSGGLRAEDEDEADDDEGEGSLCRSSFSDDEDLERSAGRAFSASSFLFENDLSKLIAAVEGVVCE